MTMDTHLLGWAILVVHWAAFQTLGAGRAEGSVDSRQKRNRFFFHLYEGFIVTVALHLAGVVSLPEGP